MIGRVPIPQPLLTTRLMAILRAPEAMTLEPLAHALVRAGVRCLEVTMTSNGALDVVGRLRASLPADVMVGAGSVVTGDQARAAIVAGAEFLVSPSTDAEVIQLAVAAGIGVYPGAWTATEVVRAWQLGATAVKLFPASSGGPGHLRQLAAPLPDIPMIAVGGVTADNAAAYLAAGAVAVGVGSALTGRIEDAERLVVAVGTTSEGRHERSLGHAGREPGGDRHDPARAGDERVRGPAWRRRLRVQCRHRGLPARR